MNQKKNPFSQGHGAKHAHGQQHGNPQMQRPGVMQPKLASAQLIKSSPAAPPAYRPQTIPKVLQCKTAPVQPSQAGRPGPRPPRPPASPGAPPASDSQSLAVQACPGSTLTGGTASAASRRATGLSPATRAKSLANKGRGRTATTANANASPSHRAAGLSS